MRKLLFIMLIFISTSACKDRKDKEPQTVTVEEVNTEEGKDPAVHYAKAEFTIEGMSCAVGCAGTIEKNLAAMEGVKTAKVYFEDKRAVVEYNEAKVSPADLALTVTGSGDGETYTVSDMAKAGDKTAAAHTCDKNCDKSCGMKQKTE